MEESSNTSSGYRAFLEFKPKDANDQIVDELIAELERRADVVVDIEAFKDVLLKPQKVQRRTTVGSGVTEFEFSWDAPFPSESYFATVIPTLVEQEDPFIMWEKNRTPTSYTVGFIGLTGTANLLFQAQQ